jgi:hypothetical protein
VAGINAEATGRTVSLDLSALGAQFPGGLIVDGGRGNLSFHRERVTPASGGKLSITLKARDGFVLVLDRAK